MALVKTHDLPEERNLAALRDYQRNINSYGYTSIFSPPGNGFMPIPWNGFKILEENGELSLRV